MPFDPTRPFTRREALAAGLTDRVLSGPRYRRLLAGAYISADVVPRPEHRAAAALLTQRPSARLSHWSVARLLGAPVPHDPDEHVVVSSKSDRTRREGVRCHVAALDARDRQVLRGLRITSPLRMFVDLAATLSLVDLVVLGDWLVRRGYTTPAALVAYCRESAARSARPARAAARYVRAKVDSPMESRLRMLLVLAGLPEPEVNRELCDGHGNVVVRLDLSYPAACVAVEYDGRHHVEVVRQWERDLARREGLDAAEWRLIVVTSKDLYVHPEELIHRVRSALRARGVLLPPPRDEWRPHFPARAA